MKNLRKIYFAIALLVSSSGMAQVQPDSTKLTGAIELPSGVQWSYKLVNGTPVYSIFNPKTRKYSLLYPAQYINRNVPFNKPDTAGVYPYVRNYSGEGAVDIKTIPNNVFGYVDKRTDLKKIIGFPDTTTLRFEFLKVGNLQRGFMLASTWDRDEVYYARGFAGDYRGWRKFVFADQIVNTVRIADVPQSRTSAGVPGTIAYGTSYLFICTGTNRWERIPYDSSDW